MPEPGNENAAVQRPILGYAQAVGWAYLSPAEALTLRRGESGTFLYSVLRDRLVDLNPGLLDPAGADAVIARLESLRASIEGNAELLASLRGERSIFIEPERRERNIRLIDFDRPAQNTFHVTEEWSYANGAHTNRADVIFLINGIPVALVEAKSPAKANAIEQSLVQVRRYHNETPELMVSPQVFNLTHLFDFHYGATWSLAARDLYNWRDEEPGNFERKIKRFFARERFLEMLRWWIVFFHRDDELRKVILRQHQTRAVDRIIERALAPDRRRGLVWHTQGSGKTLTMMKAADRILNQPGAARPTVLMLVDRNELESQLFANLNAHGLAHEAATSKRRLRELLRSDCRGLIVSTIHKFAQADANLSTRSDVYVLVDEAHRSTSGDLGTYLMAALPNATLIGFTGTPVGSSQQGAGTFKTFGAEDVRGYLDKYSMAESIADGTTLKLNYTLAPGEIRLPAETLEREFLSLAEAEGIADIEQLNLILEKAVNLRNLLKAPARVAKVAEFVARHFEENVAPLGLKAFLVGVDREACALYKEALDRHLPPGESAVVFTSAHNDPPLLSQYRLRKDEENSLRRQFRRPGTSPKILIVTEKLLTGFDAPILYCMYLDKPMRDHVLLQAIARVNRPYEPAGAPAADAAEAASSPQHKTCGLVVDFVGMFERLERTLAFDPDSVAAGIENLDLLRSRFANLMAGPARQHVALVRAPGPRDKAAEAAVAALSDPDRRNAFLQLWMELQDLFEVLSPDAALRPHLDDYARLGELYRLLQNAFGKSGLPLTDLLAKTQAMVRSHLEAGDILPPLVPATIDEATLASLQKGQADPPAVISCGLGIVHAAAGNESEPTLLSIAERAQHVLAQYQDRQMTTTAALAELQRLAAELIAARDALAASGLPPRTFSLEWALRSSVPQPRPLAIALAKLFEVRPAFADHPDQERELRIAIYGELARHLSPETLVSDGSRLADELIRAWQRNPNAQA